jgi:hypothetical protein
MKVDSKLQRENDGDTQTARKGRQAEGTTAKNRKTRLLVVGINNHPPLLRLRHRLLHCFIIIVV